MKKVVLLLFVVILAISENTCTFASFQQLFGKSYKNAEEEGFRYQIFQSNLTKLNELNNDPSAPYKLKCTSFMDLTISEISSFLKTTANPNLPISKSTLIPKVGVPTSYDWRDYKKVTPVKNQGGCGSCWAFASIAVYESFLLLKTNSIYDLSEEYVLECAGVFSGCGGGYVSDATDLLTKYGAPL